MIKAVFPASLLQSSVSHDPSEIILICWFADQETSDYYQCWKQLCCFFWKPSYIFCMILWSIESSKEQHLFETEIYCNIINVFNVTFDAFYMNKRFNFFKKNLTDPNFWMIVFQYFIIYLYVSLWNSIQLSDLLQFKCQKCQRKWPNCLRYLKCEVKNYLIVNSYFNL